MILDDLLQIVSIVNSIDLIVSHYQCYKPIVLANAFHYLFEISLELVVRQIDFHDVFVVLEQSFADHDGRLVSHALIFEAQFVISLVQLHLGHKSLLLLIGFVGNAKIKALSFI